MPITDNTAPFAIATDGVDPRKVPFRTLYTGARVAPIGLSTFGSDRFSGESIAEAVKGAIAVGYRHIDCTSVYGNEHLIGYPLREAIRGGMLREDMTRKALRLNSCFTSCSAPFPGHSWPDTIRALVSGKLEWIR